MKGALQKVDFEERLAWLHLARCRGIGPKTHRRLVDSYGGARAALDALPSILKRGDSTVRGKIAMPERRAIEDEWGRLEAMGGRFLTLIDEDYPPSLAVVADAPLVLSTLGHTHILKKDMIGIVGARRASASSVLFARQLAQELSDSGFIIVSGMAHGIDSAAHEGALQGGTVAVLAGGVDQIYPHEKENLYHDIVKLGAVISEEKLEVSPKGALFPKRNRIIAGLCLGLVVIEAEKRSGSLITASQALDYGREIFAVPGSPQDPRSWGANHLIKQGAFLITGSKDVVGHIGAYKETLEDKKKETKPIARTTPSPPSGEQLETIRSTIVSLLGPAPLDTNELLRQTDFDWQHISYVLLQLELEQRLTYHAGNRVSLVM